MTSKNPLSKSVPAETARSGSSGSESAPRFRERDGQTVNRRIRVKKEDSAFVYAVLEANEGIAAYSTLPHQPGDPHRDMELNIPVSFVEEVDRVLKELGEMIYDLD